MKKKTMKLAAVLALVLVVTGVSAYATAGGKNDPLVSLSYLNETFLDTVTEKVQELIICCTLSVTVSMNVSFR